MEPEGAETDETDQSDEQGHAQRSDSGLVPRGEARDFRAKQEAKEVYLVTNQGPVSQTKKFAGGGEARKCLVDFGIVLSQ